jgi:hypothetical protein
MRTPGKRRKKGVADFAQVFHHCEDRYTLELVAEQCEDTDKRFLRRRIASLAARERLS